MPAFPDYKVGCTAYENFFSHEELLEIEQQIWETEIKAFNGNEQNFIIHNQVLSYLKQPRLVLVLLNQSGELNSFLGTGICGQNANWQNLKAKWGPVLEEMFRWHLTGPRN